MKLPYRLIHRPSLCLAMIAAVCATLTLAPANTFAQTTTDSETIRGDFKIKATDGDTKGKYVRTITTTSTGTTDQIVYTRASDKATSTDTTTTTDNSDGAKTVAYSHNDFGATAQFTSTKTVTPEKHGDAYGNGTYMTAAGVSGVLATLESKVGALVAVSATYTTSTGITRDLRLTDSELGFTGEKIVTLNPDGTVTNTVIERYITSVSK